MTTTEQTPEHPPPPGSTAERRQAVWEALGEVLDPELGIDVVNLGLVYAVEAGEGGRVQVTMTATSPACPLNDYLVAEAGRRIRQRLPEATPVSVKLVWDPPWSPERMSEAARQQLGG